MVLPTRLVIGLGGVHNGRTTITDCHLYLRILLRASLLLQDTWHVWRRWQWTLKVFTGVVECKRCTKRSTENRNHLESTQAFVEIQRPLLLCNTVQALSKRLILEQSLSLTKDSICRVCKIGQFADS